MLTPERQAELLAEARRVDAVFSGAGVVRSDVSPVVQRYISGPGSHGERLELARHLARYHTDPACWLRKRSGSLRQRLPIVARELGGVLEGDRTEEELRFLLGWILRLAKMRHDRPSGASG